MSTTNTIDLRGLSKEIRDHEIRQTIAKEIAKLENLRWIDNRYYHGPFGTQAEVPHYAESADSVLPLLEKTNQWSAVSTPSFSPFKYKILVCITPPRTFFGEENTFPLAACYALLRANGYEVLT